ncbi:MAG: hypothetical protein AMS14_11320 [Planctomycetes bacterium DG_20]|nr:MAG: hypothetical protein AMS14_11320 [Planctomycetes bacterium DG_20]
MNIRVRLGLKPTFSHLIGASPEVHGTACGLGCDAQGQLYVMYLFGGLSHHYTSLGLKVYDRDGRYVRQVMPYSAALPPEKRRGVQWISLDGAAPVPLVFHGHSRGLYPETGATNRQSILFRPDGKLITTSDHFDNPSGLTARRVLVLGQDGAVGTDYLGPKITVGRVGGWIVAALSPDGKTIYLSGGRERKGPATAVFRTTWDNPGEPEVFVGTGAEGGRADAAFAEPRGTATDAQGNVYVCDHLNNQVAVFTADGKPLATLPAPDVDLVAVHPKTGAVYVLATKSSEKYRVDNWGSGANFLEKKLLKFADYRAREPQAVLDMPQDRTARPLLALDPTAEPPIIWLGGLRYGDTRIRKVIDRGDAFEVAGTPIADRIPAGTIGTGWIDIAVDRHSEELLIGAGSGGAMGAARYNGATGEYLDRITFKGRVDRGAWGEAAFSWDGKTVLHTTALEKHYRFDRTGNPAPWPALETHVLDGLPQGFIHARGHCAGPDGGFYILHHPDHRDYLKGEVAHVAADGRIQRRGVVRIEAPVGGVKVDRHGNIYVGAMIKPKDEALPPWFAGKVPEKQQPWYTHMYGSILKFGPAGGTVTLGDGAWLAYFHRRPQAATASGLLWAYHGLAPLPSRHMTGCSCQVARFDVDLYGRIFVPDTFRFGVAVLDNNTNAITRFGGYGNQDNRPHTGAAAGPAIPFAWVHSVQVTDRFAYVADVVNHRVVVVRLAYAAEETCPVP